MRFLLSLEPPISTQRGIVFRTRHFSGSEPLKLVGFPGPPKFGDYKETQWLGTTTNMVVRQPPKCDQKPLDFSGFTEPLILLISRSVFGGSKHLFAFLGH